MANTIKLKRASGSDPGDSDLSTGELAIRTSNCKLFSKNDSGSAIGIVAGSADTLTTARNIGGVSFDGSGNINLPGVNTSGNQDTSGNAATATALETARTIGGTSFDGTGNITPAEATNSDTVDSLHASSFLRADAYRS